MDNAPQHLINKNEVPPGGFRFFEASTERWVKAASWTELLIAVKRHRRANELPIGLMFDREVETQLCSTLPPGCCSYSSPDDKRRASMVGRPTWAKFLEGTRTLVAMVGKGMVSQTVANEQAATCSKCPFNQKPEGCTSCNLSGLADVLAGLGRLSTAHDGRLDGCVLCGCSLKAKVHFPAEVMAKVAGDNLSVYPEWCWIRKAADQLLPPQPQPPQSLVSNSSPDSILLLSSCK